MGGAKRVPPKKSRNYGALALLLVVGIIVFAVFNQSPKITEIPISQAVTEANAGKYAEIIVNGQQLLITKKGETTASLKAVKEEGATVKDTGIDTAKVKISAKPTTSTGSTLASLAIGTVLPVLLIGAMLFWMMRSAQGQGNQAMSFGKSKARL